MTFLGVERPLLLAFALVLLVGGGGWMLLRPRAVIEAARYGEWWLRWLDDRVGEPWTSRVVRALGVFLLLLGLRVVAGQLPTP